MNAFSKGRETFEWCFGNGTDSRSKSELLVFEMKFEFFWENVSFTKLK